MRVCDQPPRRGAADHACASPAKRHAGDLAVGRPLAPTDERGDRDDPIGAYSGSTQTLPAVSRLSVTSRSAALSLIVLPISSTSSRATRVPGTRFRSNR